MFEVLLVLTGVAGAVIGHLFKSGWDRRGSLTDRRREAHANFLGDVYVARRLGSTLKNMMSLQLMDESKDPDFMEVRGKLASSLAQVQILSTTDVADVAELVYEAALKRLRGGPPEGDLDPAIETYMRVLREEIRMEAPRGPVTRGIARGAVRKGRKDSHES